MPYDSFIDKILYIWLSPTIKLYQNGNFIKLRVRILNEVIQSGIDISKYVLAHIYMDTINVYGQHIRTILGVYTKELPENMHMDGMELVSELKLNNGKRQVWISSEYAENVEVEFPSNMGLLHNQLRKYAEDSSKEIDKLNKKNDKRYN